MFILLIKSTGEKSHKKFLLFTSSYFKLSVAFSGVTLTSIKDEVLHNDFCQCILHLEIDESDWKFHLKLELVVIVKFLHQNLRMHYQPHHCSTTASWTTALKLKAVASQFS